VTGSIGTDVAEARWCAYAWPVLRGNTGNRCFFVNESGNVTQSLNDVARHSGPADPPDPGNALVPGGSGAAVGTVGGDGDVWKAVN
jgi:hypothetical protein